MEDVYNKKICNVILKVVVKTTTGYIEWLWRY